MAAAAAGGAKEEEADGEQRDCSFATFLKFTERTLALWTLSANLLNLFLIYLLNASWHIF